jgi:hypothetical protein
MRYNRKLLLLTLSAALLIGTAVNLQAQTVTPILGGRSSIRPIEYTQVVEGSLEPVSIAALYTYRVLNFRHPIIYRLFQ